MSRGLVFSAIALSVLLSSSLVVSVDAASMWNKTYGGADGDEAYCLIQASDGGYALAGSTYGFEVGHINEDFWLVKTDSNGIKEWSRTYGGAYSEEAYCMVVTSDGGFALTGSTSSFDAGKVDFWLVKTDPFGNMQWNKAYGGTGWDEAYSLVQTSDGRYALAGTMLVKTDTLGNMEWNQSYAGVSLVAAPDGGFAIAAAVDGDSRLIKTDSNGVIAWNRTYGGTGYEWVHSLIATSDGGYALAGAWNYTFPPSFEYGPFYNGDYWLVKTDEFGLVPEYSSLLVPALVLTATTFIIINKKRLLRRNS